MENKKMEIAKFYEQIFSDTKLKEKLEEKAKAIVNEEDLKKLIQQEIVPLMKKFNVNFSEKELLEYEAETLKKLSEEDLLNVSGGMSVKSALLAGGLLSMALLGGVGLNASAMDNEPPSPPGEERRVLSSNNGRRQQEHNNDNANNGNNINNDNNNVNTSNSNGNDEGNYDNVRSEYDEATRTLTISGDVKMKDFYDPNGKKGTTLLRYARKKTKEYHDNRPEYDSNKNSIKNIVIKDGVTYLGSYAFADFKSLENVSIPSSVTSIGEGTFKDCRNLKQIKIPSSVTSIGKSAFAGSSLESVEFPATVTSIEERTFADSSLKSIDIPSGVISIGKRAFDSCRDLETVNIPDSVNSIAIDAFELCWSLANINVDENNLSYKSVNGVIFDKNGKVLQLYPMNKAETSYSIPDGVTSIGERAFESCNNVENIIIPSSVTNIEDYAFSYCDAIESINIPHGTLSLGRYVFNGCSKLKTVNISDSVISIGDHAFDGCFGLVNINVDKKNPSYKSENNVLFYIDKSGKILICYPAGKTEKSYKIPDDVSKVGDSAFKNSNNLLEVYIPGQVNSIGPKAFFSCNDLKTVTIAEGVNSIGNSAFWGCGFDSVEIPETVNSIGKRAFGGCKNLKVVSFENKDIAIDLDWFKGSDAPPIILVNNQKQDF